MMCDYDMSLLGYDAYPGTLNIETGHSIRDWVTRQPGVSLTTERSVDHYVPVTITAADTTIDGHASHNRGSKSLELVAPQRLRDHLDVTNGDTVTVELRREPIPKTIHQVWVGAPMPEHLAEYGRRWQKLHPDWEYRLWGEEDLQWLDHQDLFDNWAEHAPRNRGQWQANIARLEILYRHGGVYADCDMDPARPIDGLMNEIDTGAFAVWQREKGHPKGQMLSNAFVGCHAGHSTIRALLKGLRGNVDKNDGLRCTHTTGVRYWSKQILRQRLTGHIDILRSQTAFPYLPDELGKVDPDDYVTPEGSYMAHHWHNQRSGGHIGRLR